MNDGGFRAMHKAVETLKTNVDVQFCSSIYKQKNSRGEQKWKV